MYCNSCGKEIPDGANFCQFCGASVEKDLVKTKQVHSYFSCFSNKQKIWLLACGIWLVCWLILKAILFSAGVIDEEERVLFSAIAIYLPLLATMLLIFIKRIKNARTIIPDRTPLVDFMKEYDGARIEKVVNKYTGQVYRYCILSKELRIQFDDSIDINLTSDEITKLQKEFWVVYKGGGKYIISKMN